MGALAGGEFEEVDFAVVVGVEGVGGGAGVLGGAEVELTPRFGGGEGGGLHGQDEVVAISALVGDEPVVTAGGEAGAGEGGEEGGGGGGVGMNPGLGGNGGAGGPGYCIVYTW